jgi:D-arabinitol dehydrogenase (NADP+)
MKAIVYEEPKIFTLREVPIPEAGPGQVRVKILQTGICGTDLHLDLGDFMAAFPLTPGHESVGIVEQLSAGVEGFRLGEQVVISPNAHCGTCSYCRVGKPLSCLQLTGFGVNRPGALAEYVVAPAAQVHSADGLHPDVAVFAEPLSCACHCLDRVRPVVGSSALVFGAGPSGILLAQLLRSSGAAHVTVAAPTAFKLRAAEALGIDATYEMTRGELANDVEQLHKASGAKGYDVVVDATGDAAVAEACISLTGNGGTAVYYGVCEGSSRIAISPFEVLRRELTVTGTFASIESFPAAIAALRGMRVRTSGLITHRFPLADYGLALKAIRQDPTTHKVIITL